MFAVTITLLLLTILATLAVVVLYRLSRPVRMPRNPEAWLERMSAQGYRPMVRLLSREDWEFVAQHPAATSALKSQFRQRRRDLVRGYVAAIETDFHRVHELLRQTLLHAPADRPDLAEFLVRERFRFTLRVWQVRTRLALDWMGVDHTDLQRLLGTVESLSATARQVRGAA